MKEILGLESHNLANSEFWWQTIIFIVIAYLIGSINFGKIISFIKKKSLGNIGSGNFGATNAGRAFGIKGFAFVFFGDFFKAFVAAILICSLYGFPALGYAGVWNEGSVAIAMFFCLVGHAFPIYFKFKGGKGVATLLGIFFVFNWFIGITSLLLFFGFVIYTKRVSFSSILVALVCSVLLTFQGMVPKEFAFYYQTIPSFSMQTGIIVFSWFTFGFVVYTHRKNIGRIFANKEPYVNKIKEFNETISSGTKRTTKYITFDKFFEWIEDKKSTDKNINYPSKDRNFEVPDEFID